MAQAVEKGADNRIILYLDRDQEGSTALREALAEAGEIVVFHDLSQLLGFSRDVPGATILLDAATLADSPTAPVSQLAYQRNRSPIGLTTDLPLEDYIFRLREWGIVRVLIKTPPVDPEEVAHFLTTLRSPAAGFGLLRYLSSTIEMYSVSIRDMQSKMAAIERVINHFATCGFDVHELYDVRLILEEIINNAFFHAFLTASGEEKYAVRAFRSLAQDESVRIEYGSDSHRVGFSITDTAGTLPVGMVISKLERQFNREGVFDQSGRGLYLSRMLASRLIINIEPRKRTQIVALFDETRKSDRPKPLMINCIGDDSFEEWRMDPDLD
ncbi:ATP-binding protein [bacterium]|nr:ATP-binding protein [bacterium]